MKGVGVVAVVLAALVLAGCSTEPQGSNTDPAQVDAVEPPTNGACRALTPADVQKSANATRTVACSQRHTAETFHVAELGEEYDDLESGDPAVAAFANQRCTNRFLKHLGATESQALRTTLSWVWFRPSRRAWQDGARWIRCDVIGGHTTSDSFRPLPPTTEGLLAGRPDDRWVACADGKDFERAEKVPCSKEHDWRAVTAIKVGEPDAPYPGDEVVAARTDRFCESSVHAWLNYPADYEFGITWFEQSQWEAGNRLSVCWAKTSE